jgi:hypothetical protein
MRRHDGLFPHIMDFALRPSRYMHDSWAEALFTPELWARLRQSRRASPHVDRMILADLGVAQTVPAGFDTAAARLALLDAATLDRLSLHMGLVLDGAAVRQTITAEAVRGLRNTLGAETYAFAVQRAPLLAAAHPPVERRQADGDLLPRVRGVGRAALGTALAGLPEPIFKRFRLKLPQDDATDFTPTSRSAQAATLAVRVLKETEPRWASLFATPSM